MPLITTAITVVFQVGQTNIDTVDFISDVQVIYEGIAPWVPKSSHVVTDYDIAGLSTIGNAIQGIWGLVRSPGTEDEFQLNCLGKRNCRIYTRWKLQGDETFLSFEVTEVGSSQDKPSVRRRLRDAIISFLRTVDEADLDTITKATDSSYKVVSRYCAELFGEGLIERSFGPSTGGRPPVIYFLPH